MLNRIVENPSVARSKFKKRMLIISLMLFAFMFMIIMRLAYLQIKEYSRYKTLSIKNLLTLIPSAPKRGIITDRNGAVLAENKSAFTLSVVKESSKDIKSELKFLTTIIPINQHQIKLFWRRLNGHRPYQHVPLISKLSPQQLAIFAVNQYKLPGFTVDASLNRMYPLGAAMTPALGYMGHITDQNIQNINSDNYAASTMIGAGGIEKYYEKQLHGNVGAVAVEINASGHTIRTLNNKNSLPGSDIQLTLDSRLQKIAQKYLAGYTGAAVAIDPRNGAILALASTPTFDPNLLVNGMNQKQYKNTFSDQDNPMFNRATMGLFAIGSTVKPFFAMAALNEKAVTAKTKIFDPGWFKVANTQHKFRDWKHTGHGWVNLSKALRVSCDTYFYNLSTSMNISTLDNYLNEFGFGQATGIDLPHDKIGIVPSPAWKLKHKGQSWYTGNTVLTLIGQGYMLATPLQLARATMLLANKGRGYKLHLLKSMTSAGQTTDYTPTQIEDLKFAKKDWKLVDKAMQSVILAPDGTGEHFGRNPPYSVAAKTGTAQLYSHTRDEENTNTAIPEKLRNNHLFIAFAPVKNPQIVVAVVVEHAAKAAMVARKIIDADWANNNHFKNKYRG
jgi:penicillin-binding protein 2